MPRETHTTPAGATTSTWVCRRCGRAFPRTELVDDLCTDDNRYGDDSCIDIDEYDDQATED